MAQASGIAGLPSNRKTVSKSASMDSPDDCQEILGEDSGLGKILLGIRYRTSSSCLEVRVVRGERLRSFRVTQPDAPRPSTYCTVTFLPDRTEPVSTATVENSDCPRWRGAFCFEKFPWMASSSSQRCLQVQVREAATGNPMSEATLLMSSWSRDQYEGGVRVWKYLNGTQETQRASVKDGSACLTLFCRPDRLKLTLHRIEGVNSRWTAATESPEFQAKLQATLSGRVVKEATLRGLRSSVGGEVNFYDGEFNVRLGKHGHSAGCLTLRLVVTHQVSCLNQELCWLDLGADVKRLDCRNLYQSVVGNPNQSHVVSVRLNKPPVAPLGQLQSKHEA